MGQITKIAALITVILCAANTSANSQSDKWRVEVESKTVITGQTGVTVAIRAYWDDFSLGSISIPLVVRELDGGAFWTGTLPVDTTGGDVHGVTWNWSNPGWAILVEDVRPGAGCATPGNQYDGVSPDNFAINAAGVGGDTPPEPDGRDFLFLTFDVNDNTGHFEFDTACFTTSLDRIYMCEPCIYWPCDDCLGAAFNKGVITITDCDCSMLGDLNLDGAINPLDMVLMVNYVYGSESPLSPIPSCPSPNGDWNCDGGVNPLDVVLMVNYVFNGSPITPCDPCPGEKLPDLLITAADFYFNPDPAEANQPVWLWVNMHNIGWDTAFAPRLDIYQGDPDAGGILLGTGTTMDIPPGGASGYYGGQFTFTSPGPVEIYGVADFANEIMEINEDNNQNHQTLEVIEPGTARPAPGKSVLRIPIELRPRE